MRSMTSDCIGAAAAPSATAQNHQFYSSEMRVLLRECGPETARKPFKLKVSVQNPLGDGRTYYFQKRLSRSPFGIAFVRSTIAITVFPFDLTAPSHSREALVVFSWRKTPHKRGYGRTTFWTMEQFA